MTKKKKISLSLLLVAVVAGSILCITRWYTWFGNIPEPAYTTADAPQRILLTLGNEGEFSRIISWQCDTTLHSGEVRITEIGSHDTTTIKAEGTVVGSRSGKSAFYHAELNGLKPSARYSYQVRNTNKESGWASFAMPDADAQTPFSFTFMGDIQDSVGGLSASIFQHIAKMDTAPSFCMFGGDLIERPMDEYWKLVFNDWGSVARSVPIVACTGNHEYIKGTTRTLDARFPYVFAYFLKSQTEGDMTYSFSYKGVRFFLLDSNVDFWHLGDQAEWLENGLKASKEKWKVVVLHHPIYSNKGSWQNFPIRWYFKSLIEKYKVDLVLQGHEHVYARWADKDKDGRPTTPLFVTSYCSPKNYQLNLNREEDRIGTDDRFFLRINASNDSLTIQTITTSNYQPYDKVTITKQNGEATIKDYYKNVPEKVEVSNWYRKSKTASKVKAYEQEVNEWKKNHHHQ